MDEVKQQLDGFFESSQQVDYMEITSMEEAVIIEKQLQIHYEEYEMDVHMEKDVGYVTVRKKTMYPTVMNVYHIEDHSIDYDAGKVLPIGIDSYLKIEEVEEQYRVRMVKLSHADAWHMQMFQLDI